jgi:hypothetical protein
LNLFDYSLRLCLVPELFAVSFYRLDSTNSQAASTHLPILTAQHQKVLFAKIHSQHYLMPTLKVEIRAHVFQNLSPTLAPDCEMRLELRHHYFLDFASCHYINRRLFLHLDDKLHCQVERYYFVRISDLSLLLLEQILWSFEGPSFSTSSVYSC